MPDVTVREATPDDVTAIQRVAERGWNAAYGDILSTATIDAAMAEWYAADAIRDVLGREDVAFYVAERDGDVVGYLSGRPSDEEGVAILGAIYIDPAHWRSGAGTALLAEFEAFCRERGLDVVEFRVLSENQVGVSFYRHHGYSVVDERDTELFGETVRELVFRGPIDRQASGTP